MGLFRRYVGTRHKLVVWTVLVVAGGSLGIVRFQDQLATYAAQPIQIAVVVGLWAAVVMWLRWRERGAWHRLYTQTPFDRQQGGDDRRPPLKRELKRKTVTVEPISRGVIQQNGVRVEAIVDGVDKPIDVSITYVGSGGEDSGIRTGNEALDSQFVFEVEAGSNLRKLFDTEVQSALMDISVPGTLRIEQNRVSYEVPFTRLRPEELGSISRAVATIAARMRRLVKKGTL